MALILAMLSGCGGGGEVNSTPTPVPSPTPTPGQRNSNLTNLQFNESFANRGATLSATAVIEGGVLTANEIAGDQANLSLQYDANSRSYTVSVDGESQTFAPSDLDRRPELDVYTKDSNRITDVLILFRTGTPDSGLNLTYASYGGWLRTDGNELSLNSKQTYFVYGIPTQASDLPRTGSATYTTIVDGFWARPDALYSLGGTSSLSANFATGKVSTNMTLSGAHIGILGYTPSEPQANLGTLSGSATINRADASFSGTLAGSGYNGTLNGMFFGPQAAEVGASFSINNGAGSTASGAIIGKKN